MIIQVRGTSGSGKSMVVRQVMERMGTWKPVTIDGRKRPLYYTYSQETERVAVLGHYDTACGGCDTIGSAAKVYGLLQQLLREGYRRILCEGLLLSEDVKWSSQLPDLCVVYLSTPLPVCLIQIQQRRAAVGNTAVLDPTKTTNRVRKIDRAYRKLKAAGVYGVCLDTAAATEVITQWLTHG